MFAVGVMKGRPRRSSVKDTSSQSRPSAELRAAGVRDARPTERRNFSSSWRRLREASERGAEPEVEGVGVLQLLRGRPKQGLGGILGVLLGLGRSFCFCIVLFIGLDGQRGFFGPDGREEPPSRAPRARAPRRSGAEHGSARPARGSAGAA